jgi:hypothetical protein
MDSCIYSVLGREFSDGLLRAVYGNESAAADGFVCAPSCARGNRSHQFFFVNGRYVKSQMLQAALEQAYKNSLFTGRFPSCVLYLKVDPFRYKSPIASVNKSLLFTIINGHNTSFHVPTKFDIAIVVIAGMASGM